MKRILLQFFAALFLIMAPMHSACAESKSLPIRIGNFFKDVYTFEYLNGKKGEYRNASLMQKIIRQPGRALITAAVYGTSFLLIKNLYDLADQHGLFNEMRKVADRAKFDREVDDYRERARERYKQVHPFEHVNPGYDRIIPEFANPVNQNIQIAPPLQGRQLHVAGIPQRPGFYHMQSDMPRQFQFNEDGERIDGPCGIYCAYNIARLDCLVRGLHLRNDDFDQALVQAIPNLRMIDAQGGATNGNVTDTLAGLGIAPVIVLAFNQNGQIQRLDRAVRIQDFGDEYANQMAFEQAYVDAAEADTMEVVQRFRAAQGPRAAHFLCAIPGHWIAISVVKNERNQQAMYLYDNLNEHPHAIAAMVRHIENIYHRFF